MRYWTCQRVVNKVKCGQVNPRRLQLCAACGKRRPPTKRPAHLRILDEMTYEDYIELNGGEFCGICGAPRKEERRLDRDHEHTGTGIPRGLLCNKCNQGLNGPRRFGLLITPEWLRAASDYLERAERMAALRS